MSQMEVNFCPFPIIKTESLKLRRLGLQDAADLFDMRSDPRMHEYTDTRPDRSVEETRKYIQAMNRGIDENVWVVWAIEHRPTGRVIGTVCIWNLKAEQVSGELGYGLHPEYQGQGLMREALLAVIDYGFSTMQLGVLEAYTEERNLKSRGLLKRCGFSEIGLVEEMGDNTNRLFRMVVYRQHRDWGKE